MTRTSLLIASIILFTTSLRPQSITITFDASLNGSSIPLDSILVMNLTAGGDTTIYYPDNELVLGVVGIREAGSLGFSMRSLPNPFAGSTEVLLDAMGGAAVIVLQDVAGRELVSKAWTLGVGTHRFRVHCERAGVHLLTVVQGDVRRTIRLMATEGNGATNVLHLVGTERAMPKSDRSLFTWSAGDELRYIGFAIDTTILNDPAIVNSAAIDEVPVASAIRTFVMAAGVVCTDSPTVTDIDGNIYRVVQIGNQCWMAANLKTTRYRDGSIIPHITDNTAWTQLTTAAWSNYENSPANDTTYGKLYNWYAAANPNTCPQGWHVPTDAEWTQLELALGMPTDEVDILSSRGQAQNVGGKMKANTTLWNGFNAGANNESGFSALPAGYRFYGGGGFYFLGLQSYWWSTSVNGENAWFRRLSSGDTGALRLNTSKKMGVSLRCVRD